MSIEAERTAIPKTLRWEKINIFKEQRRQVWLDDHEQLEIDACGFVMESQAMDSEAKTEDLEKHKVAFRLCSIHTEKLQEGFKQQTDMF